MKLKSRIRDFIMRGIAGLICAVLVLTMMPGMPGSVAHAEVFPTTSGNGLEFSFTYNGNPVTSSTSLSKGDILSLKINITNSGGINGWDNYSLATGTEYVIPLGGSNVVFVGGTQQLTADFDGYTYHYGNLYPTSGGIAIQFLEDPNGTYNLSNVIDANIIANCTLDGTAVDNNSSNSLPITLPNDTSVTVTVTDWVAIPATDPAISKSSEKDSYKKTELGTDGTIKWTVKYTAPTDGNVAGGYSGDTPKYIEDTIPAGLTYDHSDSSSATNTGNKVKFTITNPTVDETFVYYTKLDGTKKNEDYWQNSNNTISYSNTAQLINDDGTTPTKGIGGIAISPATKTVNVVGPDKPGVNKSGNIREEGADKYIDWKVTIDPKKSSTAGSFTSFTLKDTLGNALDRPTAIVVNSASKTPRGTGQVISVDVLTEANAGSSITVTYSTKIKSGLFTEEALKNNATVEWTIPASSGSAIGSASKQVAPNIGTLDFSPIKKSHTVAYDYSKRQFTWDITIGNEGASFKKIVIEDSPIKETTGNLTNVITHRLISSLNENKDTPPTYTFKTDAEKEAEEEAFIKQSIETALAAKNISATVTVDITLGTKTSFSEGVVGTLGTADKVKIEIVPTSSTTVIDKPFTFNMHSYSSYPIEYAGNNGGDTNHTNQVKLTTETLDGSSNPLSEALEATDNQTNKIHDSVNKSVVSFDPSKGEITWKIDLNGTNAPLENVMLEDTMQKHEGKSVASYLPGSAVLTIGGTQKDIEDVSTAIARTALPKPNDMYAWAKSKVYTNGDEKIFFMIKDLNQSGTLTYKTVLNKNTNDVFKKSTSIAFTNNVKLINRDIYSPTGDWHPFQEQSGAGNKTVTVPNNVMSKTSNFDSAQTGNKVTYSIAINPYGMTMNSGSDFTLTDTISNSIIIDEDSVKVWKGVRTTITGDNFTNADKLTKPAKAESIAPTFDHSSTDVKMQLTLQDATPYIIEYDAYVVKALNGLENNVSLGAVTYPHKTGNAESKVTFNFASSSYATLSLPKKMLQNQYLSISIKKLGSTGMPLANADFSLYKTESDTTAIASGTTDSKGLLTLTVYKSKFGGTIPSISYLEETSDPSGHKRIPGRIPVETASLGAVDGQPDITLQNISSSSDYGTIKIKKKETGSSTMLAGAVFGVYSEVDCTNLKFKGTTNSSGELNVVGLLKDTKYWVKELQAPTGYTLDSSVKEVTATDAGAEVEFENSKSSGGLGGPAGGDSGESSPIKTPEVSVPPVVPVPENITVTFETPIGITPPMQIKSPGMTADDPQVVIDPATLTPGTIIDGYEFGGWYLDKELTIPYNFGNTLTESITLYAKWSRVRGMTSPLTGDKSLPIMAGLGIGTFFGICILLLLNKKKYSK